MKTSNIILTIIAITLLSFSLASAQVNQTVNVRYGIINADNSFTATNTPVTGASLVGFVCSSNDCSATSDVLFNGDPLLAHSNSYINVQYPTILKDHGYGIFVYENGYIPYTYLSNFAGTGQASNYTVYLSRKTLCNAPIQTFTLTNSSNTLNIAAQVASPFVLSGGINFVPAQLASQYTSNVQVKLDVIGPTGSTETKDLSISTSSSKLANFTKTVAPGTYTIMITSSSNDPKCSSTLQNVQTKTITIASNTPADTIAPVLTVYSPQNTTYTNSHVLINFTATDNVAVDTLSFFDGHNTIKLTTPFTVNLADGTYTYKFFANDTSGNLAQESRTFTVNTAVQRPISLNIVSPQPITYNTTDVLLNISSINADNILFTIAGRVIDVPYSGPVILHLTPGNNLLTVNANNAQGFNASKSVAFVVVNGTQNNQTNQTNQTIPQISLNIVSPQPITYNSNIILVSISTQNATLVKYSVNGLANLTYTGPINILFPNGTNTLTAFASNTQGASITKAVTFTVSPAQNNQTNQTQDTTAPSSASNLMSIARGTNFITWNWSNPIDADFNQAIIYLNGVNVFNTSANFFNATGLAANTSYTIRINTKDFTGNVNYFNVTNTDMTSALPGNNTSNNQTNNTNPTPTPSHNTNGGNKKTILGFPLPKEVAPSVPFEEETINMSTIPAKTSSSQIDLLPILILLALMCLLLLILLILYAAMRNNRQRRVIKK